VQSPLDGIDPRLSVIHRHELAAVRFRLLAAEITREKLYLRVHEELPYSAAVDTTIAPVASNVTKTGDGYVITVKVTPDGTLDGSKLAAK